MEKNPDTTIAQYKHHVFISGLPKTETIESLCAFFIPEVFENCISADVPLFRLVMNNPGWKKLLGLAFEDRTPIEVNCLCYQFCIKDKISDIQIPRGFKIFAVDKTLIGENFQEKEELLEKMCSERYSVDDFLQNSFGVVAFKGDLHAGWCLSEYNYGNRCEVGVATMTPFQRQGLAKAMTRVFINEAF